MAFHETQRRRFLQQSAATVPAPDRLLAPVMAYAVRVEPAQVAGDASCWRLLGVYHLPPDENRGGHQIFIDVVDEQGARVPLGEATVRWGWEGQRADETAPPRPLDKPDPEPAAVVDVFGGQHVWVEIAGDDLPSDRVANLHTGHADEPGSGGEIWNSWGHHSFYLLFQRRRAATATAPTPTTTETIPDTPAAVPALAVQTFGPVSQQDIINAFALAAGDAGLDDPWALLTRAGLNVETLAADRWARYTGPPLHELPNLSVAEKNLLMRQLAQVLATMPTPPSDDAPPIPTQGNRLGFYLHLSTDQSGLWEAIRTVQPPVILVHADTVNRTLLREIRAFRAPNSLVIGRLFKDTNTQHDLLTGGDPTVQGAAMADEILGLDFGLATERGDNGRLLIDAWMSLNEAVPGPASRQFAEQPEPTAALLRAYDLFQVAFHRRLQEAGVEAVAFNFGAGNFSNADHYLTYFPQTLAAYTYLGFHEYGWPTLHPAPGSATSAGLYRTCMAGIRARYGPRHRVVITEAGLTRMYRDPDAGDVGWLNPEQTLSQDAYWQTLAWYNQHLLADDNVVGACLYEVGHHGDWATFRHLGADNAGQPLRLTERIAALAAAPRGRGLAPAQPAAGAQTPPPRPHPTPSGRGVATPDRFVRVQGSEFIANGRPLRFIGVNIRGLVHYGDGHTLPATRAEDRREQVRAARAMGARVVRVFLPSVQVDTAATIGRLQDLISLLREESPDLYLIPALCNLYRDVEFRIPGDDGFYSRSDPNFPGDLLNAAFFQGGYRTNYLPFVRQVVAALRDEPAILAWEIGNELKLNPVTGNPVGDPNVAAFLDFMHIVAQEIRGLDANHLVTTGLISTHHAWLHTPDLRDKLYAGPDFDFLTVHCYNDERQNDDSELARRLGKPFIVEEAGYGLGFGGDRSPKLREDINFWFGRGARGYMPWGFMATAHDIGDGDRDSGLDRSLHGDWEPLFHLLQQQAGTLAQTVANLPAPQAAVADDGDGFHIGQTVYSTDWLNVRRSSGYVGKPGDDILGMASPAAAFVIGGGPEVRDGLTWWQVQTTLDDARTINGWAAEAVNGTSLLTATPPTDEERARPRGVGPGSGTTRATPPVIRYATTYVNLRQTPGYVGKSSEDVVGQIPYGAAVELLGGPVNADGLAWWSLRAPMQDNSVATGWAATIDPDGVPLLIDAPPSPPVASEDNVHGAPFQPRDALTSLAVTHLRPAAALPLADSMRFPLLPHSVVHLVGGPESRDGLEWWQLTQTTPDGQTLTGWSPLTSADGTRLLATTSVAQAIRVARPFAGTWPISQGWGLWGDYYRQFCYDGVALRGHNGVDFALPVGTPVLAVDDGEVIRIDFEPDGFGQFVILAHTWGETLYAHLDRIDVGQGTRLGRGQPLGISGNSGASTGPHLHFGLRILPYRRTDGWGGFVNPLPFMQLVDLPTSRVVTTRPADMTHEVPGRRRP